MTNQHHPYSTEIHNNLEFQKRSNLQRISSHFILIGPSLMLAKKKFNHIYNNKKFLNQEVEYKKNLNLPLSKLKENFQFLIIEIHHNLEYILNMMKTVIMEIIRLLFKMQLNN